MTQLSGSITSSKKLQAFLGVSLQIMGIVFVARFIMDTGTRMLYPFIPQFSTGLGLTVVAFSWLIFIRAIAGMAGPIFGLLADRFGRRKVMASGLFGQGLAVIGVALSWQWWAVLPMIVYGLSLAAFIPAEQAYISDQAPFHKRGRALGTIELSWALVGIISMPIVGWLIDAFGWQASFLLLSCFSFLGAVLIWFRLPSVEHRSHNKLALAEMWQICLRPNVLAAIGVALFLFVAVSIFITVWGIWLNEEFNLSAAALGVVATAIGVAELSGSGLSSLFIDRIGKRRGSLGGLLALTIAFLILPLTQYNLVAAIAGLVLMGICVEFSIVALLPLYAEQAPEARATIFSLTGFGVAIGVASGSPLTAMLWSNFGLWAVCGVAAICVLIAWGLVTNFLPEVSESVQQFQS